MTECIYLEAHVNINLVPDNQSEHINEIAKRLHWKKSNMNGNDPEQISKKIETIFTTHSQDKSEMNLKVQTLVNNLHEAGYKVLRYKIEAAVVDSRVTDIFHLLN